MNAPSSTRLQLIAAAAAFTAIALAIYLASPGSSVRRPRPAPAARSSEPVAAVEPPPESAKKALSQGIEGETHKHTNALIHETSPYLLQHAHNPVNWRPWGPEAFEIARKQNKPVFLSVGYSTCYWCHVMERESFENEEVAAILNEHFVCIKVDREERPDLDEQYMLATQLLGGRGGWPNSVWLMPDGRPWMAGTYFPRERFIAVLNALTELWSDKRDLVEKQAESFAAEIKRVAGVPMEPGDHPLSRELIDRSIEHMRSNFDEVHAGFGGAPKFPPHGDLKLLLREAKRTKDDDVLLMATRTLDAIWLGGIHDHLGGGFHRYSTDDRWLLPHFEKMLYDNAQLMRAYSEAYALTGDELYRAAVADIYRWLTREMTHPQGGFYSAIDAGPPGEEGKFYVWTLEEVHSVLGEDAQRFAQAYGCKAEGNYKEEATGEQTGANVLHLAEKLHADDEKHLATLREKLLGTRRDRKFPHKDDKILASWNGLMIAALAHAGRTLEEPRYTDSAAKAADFVLALMVDDGRLKRSWREGEARLPGYLDDYAYFIDALLEVHETTGQSRYLAAAEDLAAVMVRDFADADSGGFFFTSSEHEELIVRSKNLFGGGNLPSANGVAAQALLRLSESTGKAEYAVAARGTLEAVAGFMHQTPQAAESMVLATAMWLDREGSAARPSTADARYEKTPIVVEGFLSRDAVKPGDSLEIAVRFTIPTPWHLYGLNPDHRFVVPTIVSLQKSPVAESGELVRPKALTKADAVLRQDLAIYEGAALFRLPITIADGAAEGETTLRIEVRFQACDQSRCLEPHSAVLELPITIDAGAEPQRRHSEIFKKPQTE